MGISRKFLLFILLTQLIVLGAAFYGFAGKLNQSQLQREADIFSVTTNLQYTELLENDETSAADALLGTVRYISRLPGIIGAQLFNETGQLILSIPQFVEAGNLPVVPTEPQARFDNEFLAGQPEPLASNLADARVLQVDIPVEGQEGQTIAMLRFYRDGTPFWKSIQQQNWLLGFLALVSILLTTGITAFLFIRYDSQLQRSRGILRVKNEELLHTQQHLLLSAKMTAIGSMTAHLMHDLKSYANRIRHSLERIGERDNKLIPVVDEAFQSARDMDRRMREFLSLLRSQSNDFQSTYEATEIFQVIRQKIMPVAEEAEIVFKIQHDGPSFKVDFNKGNFLILILQNLLHNAVEVTRPGEELLLRLDFRDQTAEFRVIDHGPGIPQAKRADLFAPKNSFKQGGTGLGLAICAQMAYHIGAGISLESSDFSGSCFLVTLPVGKSDGVEIK